MEVKFSSSTKISESVMTLDGTGVDVSSLVPTLPSVAEITDESAEYSNSLCKTASFGSMLLENELIQSEQIHLRELLDETEDTWYPLFESEKLIIGETIRDNTAQTEPSEIEDIKLLMAQAEKLKDDRKTIQQSQEMTWQTVDAIYHKNISEKAFMIYARTNKQMDQIDSLCRKRIIEARQSARQELDDGIKKVSEQYKEYYEKELQTMMRKRRQSKHYSNLQSGDMQSNVDDCIDDYSDGEDTGALQDEIDRLTQENADLRGQLEHNSTPQVIMDTSAADAAKGENQKLTKQIEKVQQTCENLKADLLQKSQLLDASERKASMFEAQFKAERESNKKLSRQIEEINASLREIKLTHKAELKQQAEEINAKSSEQIASQKRHFDVTLDDHRKMAAEEVAKRDVQIEELRKIIAGLQGKVALAEKQPKRRSTVKQPTPSPMQHAPPTHDDMDESGDKDAKVLQEELMRTRRELDSSNRNWEKRFSVLRASLHELKDESFLRKRIEYQPLALHTTSYPAHPPAGSAEPPAHVLPPLKPGHVKKTHTANIRRQMHGYSPAAMSDTCNFSSGSDTDAQDSDADPDFRPLKHKPSNRSITR